MIQVAVLGFGVVGSGVAELIRGTGEGQTKPADDLIALKYILDVRDFPQSAFADCFVKDFSVIEKDPEVTIVVETIGGATVALDFTERALKAGKSVVTSNKEIVAQHGYRLMNLAREHGVTYLFEASVGGGIPVLRPLNQCLAANEISEICGILNGTTNYIFTRMIAGGLPFETALREAQEKGYAEQDPTADIEGIDSCRKICILASIAFGFHILPDQVETTGISRITLEDVACASACGYKIKLLGRAVRQEDGRICAYVEPQLVSLQNPLAGVEDVFNAITVKGHATGDVMFYGKGAGKLPTASAVVADVIAIARQMERSAYQPWQAPRPELTISSDSIQSRFMVRLSDGSVPGKALNVAGLPAGEQVFLTEPMTRPQLVAQLKDCAVVSVLRALD